MLRHRAANSFGTANVEPIIRLWLLRILVPLRGCREFLHQHGFHNDALAEVLGLGHWIDPSSREFDFKAVQSELRQLHQKAEDQWFGAPQSALLGHNVGQLSKLVGLSTNDEGVQNFV